MTNKSDRQWYPRYAGDYARKTSHLSLCEHGAYALLMDWYYSNAKPIPDDWVQMHRICKAVAPDEQIAVQSVIHEFFTFSENGWRNSRADSEILKKAEISEKRRQAQAAREKIRLQTECKKTANAITTTATSTVVGISKDIPTDDKSTALLKGEMDQQFQRIWSAYPSRGKNGARGAAFKGDKKVSLKVFQTIYQSTKEKDRETLIGNIIAGCRGYSTFIDGADYPSKHLSTWLNAEGWKTDYALSQGKGVNTGRSEQGHLESVLSKVMADQTWQHSGGAGGNQSSKTAIDASEQGRCSVLDGETDWALSKKG